jgi:hypothetical protein
MSFGMLLLNPITVIFASDLALQRALSDLSETESADSSEIARKISVAMLFGILGMLIDASFFHFLDIRHHTA